MTLHCLEKLRKLEINKNYKITLKGMWTNNYRNATIKGGSNMNGYENIYYNIFFSKLMKVK